MTGFEPEPYCCQCISTIETSISLKSIKKYGYSLCEDCQIWFSTKVFYTTQETLQLYFALRRLEIKAELEKKEELKRSDIRISGSAILIEVDTQHHNHNHEQTIKDLHQQLSHPASNDHPVRIPSPLIKWELPQVTRLIYNAVYRHDNARIFPKSRRA